MAEVATRTQKGAVLNDMQGSASGTFDVRSPKGLTDVLRAAKASGMKDDAYAAFRDMILEYAHGGGSDATLRQKIEAASQGFTLPAPKIEEKSAPTAAASAKVESFVGTARPTPTFSRPVKTEVQIKPEPRDFVPPNLPVASIPKVAEEKVETPKVAAVASKPVPIQKIAVPAEVKEQPRPSMPPVIQTIDQYKARIAEIKRTVNAQVGNPIVLMDGNNAVGREYMAALLAAMKAVSGNAPGTLQSSMDQLEKSFAKVAKLGETGSTKESPATPPKSDAPRPQEVAKKSVPAVPVSMPLVSKPQVKPIEREEVVKAAPVMKPVSASSAPVSKMPLQKVEKNIEEKTPIKIEEEHVSVSGTRTPFIPPVTRAKTSEIPAAAIAAPAPTPKTETVPAAASAIRKSSAPLPPIPSATVIDRKIPEHVGGTSPAVKEGGKHAIKGAARSGFDVTTPGEVDNPVPPIVKDDLHTPEIDAGLDQLLHEWSIFRGSGLFGTGPGGREHPLFKKLAPLPMEMVVAGTWENANKEVILSIRDYASGWMHEQGVAYVPTESLEMYLRRVIKRILKRTG